MKALVSKMITTINTAAKYIGLFQKFLIFNLNALMAYKVNFIVQSWYAPAYVLVMFALVKIAYQITPSVAGWSQQEGYLLFLVFQTLFVCCFVIFLKGVRMFLYTDLRQGKVDFYLTKPVNSQFLAFFSKPEVEQLLLLIGLTTLLARQIWLMSGVISFVNLLSFIPIFILGIIVVYGTISFYAGFGFYLVRASQLFEIFLKATDFGQYPLSLFPPSFQLAALTVIPMAFFSYVPTLFLLGRGNWFWAVSTLAAAIISVTASKLLWQHSLKQYSSASS